MWDCKDFKTTLHHPCEDKALKGQAYMDAVWFYYEEKDDVMRDVLRLADEHRCLLILDPSEERIARWYYLHPSLRVDGWQLSHFDWDGPVSHDNIGDDPHELSHSLPDTIECWYVA